MDVVRVMQSADYSMKETDDETMVMDSRLKTFAGKLHNYTFNAM